MSSQDQDVVDTIFSIGHSVIARGNKLVSEATNKISDSVQRTGVSTSENPFKSSVVNRGSGGTGRIFEWLYGRRNILWGVGLTTVGVLLSWQLRHLVRIPSRLPQSETKCVLVLGDMRDPIIRSQVMDLYRRRFVVFVCTSGAKARPNFENHQEEDDFLRFIDPNSSSDLAEFVEFISRQGESRCELASILFMPNLSYYPSGDSSMSQLNTEIETNVFLYYVTLLKLLPHLKGTVTQLILFNPSLSYNLAISHHPVEILISGLIQSIYCVLKEHKKLYICMVHVGLLQVGAQLSTYKYLNLPGSNINEAMLRPVYDLIAVRQGNCLLRLGHWIKTLGTLNRNTYCGKLSFVSRLPFGKTLALGLK